MEKITNNKQLHLDSEILGDPAAVNRVDKMSMVKVYCKIETSPWAITLTEPVPDTFDLPASDWAENFFSGQSAKRGSFPHGLP